MAGPCIDSNEPSVSTEGGNFLTTQGLSASEKEICAMHLISSYGRRLEVAVSGSALTVYSLYHVAAMEVGHARGSRSMLSPPG